MLRSALLIRHAIAFWTGQRVSFVGQTVHVPPLASGQMVIEVETAHRVARPGHLVCATGHIVAATGQTVNAVVLSAHSVTSPVQRVGVTGHFVNIAGHSVST
jgi:hypothetical protein